MAAFSIFRSIQEGLFHLSLWWFGSLSFLMYGLVQDNLRSQGFFSKREVLLILPRDMQGQGWIISSHNTIA